jgi:hypothetical protein
MSGSVPAEKFEKNTNTSSKLNIAFGNDNQAIIRAVHADVVAGLRTGWEDTRGILPLLVAGGKFLRRNTCKVFNPKRFFQINMERKNSDIFVQMIAHLSLERFLRSFFVLGNALFPAFSSRKKWLRSLVVSLQ